MADRIPHHGARSAALCAADAHGLPGETPLFAGDLRFVLRRPRARVESGDRNPRPVLVHDVRDCLDPAAVCAAVELNRSKPRRIEYGTSGGSNMKHAILGAGAIGGLTGTALGYV